MSIDSDDEKTVVVIDNGSYMCKCGFAGDKTVTDRFRSVIETHKYEKHENLELEDSQRVGCPIQRGIVVDWEGMENVWRNVFYNKLRIEPRESHVCVTEHTFNTNSNREIMAQIMFESFGVEGFALCNSAILSLFASGLTTGIVLDCGQGVTHVVPVVESVPIYHAMDRIDMAGQDVTRYLQNMMFEKGYSFQTQAEIDVVRRIKERACYVAMDYDQELACNDSKSHRLPYENQITLGKEHFKCFEALFQPHLIGLDCVGVDTMIHNAIMKTDVDNRRKLFGHIILAGSTTMIKGFQERILKGMKILAPSDINVKVIAPPERNKSSWIGGSIVGSLTSYETLSTSKQEYEEFGATVIHKRCL